MFSTKLNSKLKKNRMKLIFLSLKNCCLSQTPNLCNPNRSHRPIPNHLVAEKNFYIKRFIQSLFEDMKNYFHGTFRLPPVQTFVFASTISAYDKEFRPCDIIIFNYSNFRKQTCISD